LRFLRKGCAFAEITQISDYCGLHAKRTEVREIRRNLKIARNPQKPENCVKSANPAQSRIPRKTCEIAFHTRNKRNCANYVKRGAFCVGRNNPIGSS
jgi:hypothetical protein